MTPWEGGFSVMITRLVTAKSNQRLVKLFILLGCLGAGLTLPGATGDAGAASWEDAVAAARNEGELVVVLGGAASRNYRPIFRLFEDQFGIRTVVSTGGGGKQADRILAERAAGKYEVDIVMVGGTTANDRLVPNGVLDPIDPVLFRPDVVKKSLWYKERHHYSDAEEKYVFAFSGTADITPVVMRFNTKKLPIEEAKKIDSTWTFLDKRFAGEIVALPPTIAGAGGTYFVVPVHPDLGEKYLRRFFSPELKVAFTQDYRQISDGVARGKYTMAIFVGSAGRDIDSLGRKGLPVANFSQVIDKPLKERPLLGASGASNNLTVVNRRPHPNATKLFVNWFLSKEGQTVVHTKSEGVPDQTLRVDVTEKGKLDENEMRKSGIEYLMLEHDREILKKRDQVMNRAEELYREIRGR
jgi:ABC-type Fe3+ transport system substrate-binding protein